MGNIFAEQYLLVGSRSGISHEAVDMRKQAIHWYCKEIFFCLMSIS